LNTRALESQLDFHTAVTRLKVKSINSIELHVLHLTFLMQNKN